MRPLLQGEEVIMRIVEVIVKVDCLHVGYVHEH